MSARQKRPLLLDPDEFDHLPEVAYIPVESADTVRQHAVIRLGEMTRGGTALLIYSSRDRLVAAYGANQPVMTLPARHLPRLQRQLGFDVVLLDVAVPSELREAGTPVEGDHLPVRMDVDGVSGEPLVYVPSRPYRAGDRVANLELQPLANGRLALLIYSSKRSLLDGCGPEQHYVSFPTPALPEVMRQCGADQVLIDTPLPSYLRP